MLTLAPQVAQAGAWGVGSFNNDNAADWFDEVQTRGLPAVHGALAGLHRSGYLDIDRCSAIIAAADLIASISGGNTNHLPRPISGWSAEHKRTDITTLILPAIAGLRMCADASRSELAQLWIESSPQEWDTHIKRLTARLAALSRP
jgi:hypothetical protein